MGKSESLKTIEKHLHPCPKINGLDIMHCHRGQHVYFDAWDGDNKANDRELKIHKQVVLSLPDFYNEFPDDLEWLAEVVL